MVSDHTRPEAMLARGNLASGTLDRLFHPALVASLLFGTAGASAFMGSVLVMQSGVLLLIGFIASVVIGLCALALCHLIAYPYRVRWDDRALELTYAFRREVVRWADVEFFRKLSAGYWPGGARVEGETRGVGALVRYGRTSDGGRRSRWALVPILGFVPAESFGVLGPPISPRKYTTPFDVYARTAR